MAFWIGVGVVFVVMAGLAALGNRTRRGNRESWKLSRSPDGGRAERNATGTTVTGGPTDAVNGGGGF